MRVGRTTPGLPGCEFPSRRQVAISHAQRQACAISQRRTHVLPYAFRIRVRVPVCLSPAMQVGRTCSADRGASSLAGGKWISHARRRACSISHCRNNKWLYALRIRLRVLVFLPEPRHARRSHHARATRGRAPQRQVASFHARVRACAISQRHTDRWLYASGIRLCGPVFLPEPAVQVGCTTPGGPGGAFPSRRQVAISHA